MALTKQILCGLGLALAFGAATGQGLRDPKARGYTQGEWALLPEWCIDSQDGPYGSPEGGGYTNKSPRAGKWVSLMGQDFWHMHHYCRGLRDFRRAQAAGISRRDRETLLQRAVAEFEYIINTCKQSMVLMPEVYLRMGETFLLQQRVADASAAFEEARRLKPDYWPAYDRWITVLLGIKQYDAARRLANEGLAHAPDQPTLLAHLKTINARSGQRAATAPR